MATTCTVKATKSGRALTLTWNLTGTDAVNGDGSPDVSSYRDICVHCYGTFNLAQVSIQGSNDPRAEPGHADNASAVWTDLTDKQGNAVTAKTTAFIEQIQETPRYMRAIIGDQGDASTDIQVVILASRD